MKRWSLKDDELKNIMEQDLISDQIGAGQFKKNIQKYYKMYYNEPADQGLEEIQDKSEETRQARDFNVSLPLTTMAVDKNHARMLTASHQRPMAKFAPVEENDVKLIPKVQEWFDYELFEGIKDFDGFLDEGLLIWIIEGQWIPTVKWRKDSELIYKEYGPFPLVDQSTGQNTDPVQLIRHIIQENESRIITFIDTAQADIYRIEYVEKNTNLINAGWINKKAEIEFYLDDYQDMIKAVYYGEKIEYDGVELITENLDFLYFPVDAKSFEFKDCDHLMVQYDLTVGELLTLKNQGFFDITKEQFEQIAKGAIQETKEVNKDNVLTEIRDLFDFGHQTHFSQNYVSLIDATYYLDVNNDGRPEKVFITAVLNNPGTTGISHIIRKKYIDEVLPYPERPQTIIKWDLIPRSAFGRGIPEKSMHIQETVDDVFCQTLNMAEQIMFPPGFFGDTVGGPFAKQNKIYTRRGEFIKVQDPDKVKYLTPPSNVGVGNMLLQMLYAMWERLLNVNDQVMGKAGAARTATATVRLLGESHQNMATNLRRGGEGLQKVYLKIYKYYQAYMPPEKAYRILGPDGNYIFKKITREELIQNPDIKVNLDIESTSKMFQREIYTFLFERIIPLYLQTGLIGQGELWKIGKNMLNVFDQKNVTDWFKKPQNVEEYLDPAQENYITSTGGIVKAKPEENHEMHIGSHTTDLQQQPAGMPIERLVAKRFHIMEHQQQWQLQQQMLEAAKMAMTSQNVPYAGSGGTDFMLNTQQNTDRGDMTAAYGRANENMGSPEQNRQITGQNMVF